MRSHMEKAMTHRILNAYVWWAALILMVPSALVGWWHTLLLLAAIMAYSWIVDDLLEDSRRVRHLRRGTTYRVLGPAALQTSQSLGEGAPLVVYRGEHDGRLWARPTSEFDDGRFEELD